MSGWDLYNARMSVHGNTKREASKKFEIRMINNKLPDNLSYTEVRVFDKSHGWNITTTDMLSGSFMQNVSIINSDNLNEKYIYSMPDDDIQLGSLINWMDDYWLVTERDANATLYTKAKLIQCNYLLKWVSTSGEIIEQWCVVEDGTKYMSGYYEDRDFIIKRGDSRIEVTIAKNTETNMLGRENRFLVDDDNTPIPLAYQLTKPLKVGHYYNNDGVYKFVLQEVSESINDNRDLMIADYYKYFPRESTEEKRSESIPDTVAKLPDLPSGTERTVWI